MDKSSQKVLAELEDVDVNQASISSQPESNKLLDTAKTVGEFVLDVTPVIGDIKGAIEYEDDMKMARGLMEMGYDENSITKMGMGAGLAALSTLGLVPVLGMGADVGRAALKPAARAMAREMDEPLSTVTKQLDTPSVSKQTEDVFMPEFRKEQIEQAKKLPASERRKFLKEVNRPTPKVFHGARGMREGTNEAAEKFTSTLDAFRNKNLNDPVYDLFTDKETGIILDGSKKIDDIVDGQGVDNFALSLAKEDGTIDTVDIAFLKGADGTLDVHKINNATMDIDETPLLKIKPKENSGGTIQYADMLDELKSKQSELSLESFLRSVDPSKLNVGKTRIDTLVEEGFQPYESFTSAKGLSSNKATGEHSELREKMLSTTRDPLVAMKPTFGGGDTGNVVYADLPEGSTRSMTPQEYTIAAKSDLAFEDMTKSQRLPELETGQIGYRLPKSIHLEGEEAIVMPENLNPKAVADNPELLAKVQKGQDMVDKIITDAKGIQSNIISKSPTNSVMQRQGYNSVKKTLKDLQSLGQYTEQYGARGTYDDLLESLIDDERFEDFQNYIFYRSKKMKPETEMARNMDGLREVMLRIRQQTMQGARGKSNNMVRDIPDSLVSRAVYGGGKGLSDKDFERLEKAGIYAGKDYINLSALGYKDLKNILLMGTQKFNRGGLVARK